MTEHDDPLWNPDLDGDAELQRLQALLAPFGAKARGVAEWRPRSTSPALRTRWMRRIAAAALAASVLLYAGHVYRLAWSDGQPWQVTGRDALGAPLSSLVAPGHELETGAQQSMTIAVARIGEITLSPESKLRLIETRSRRHRVDLESGHLRARIWAPPGYFRVSSGMSEVVDLGCDFDLWKRPDGSGRVYVRSGWVEYRIGLHEVLLPAGYGLQFDAHRPSTPLRPEANAAFVKAIGALEQALVASGASSAETIAASDAVAAAAQDADAFTLLSLLSSQPRLAEGALYPRLARAFKTSDNDAVHRAAWAAGDIEAINAWWRKMPTQPKHWWANWTDAFG